MGPAPELSETLFVPSREELLRQIRMEGVPLSSDAIHAVGRGVRAARVRVFSELGATNVQTILGIPYDPNTMTPEGLIRLCANELEALIVEKHLAEHLPTVTVGNANFGSPGFIDDEGLTRQLYPSEVTRRVDMLELEICRKAVEIREALGGGSDESSTIQGFVI